MKKTRLMAGAVAIGLALAAGPAMADYGAGKAYYDSGRYQQAAAEFSAAAEGGHALAQYMMGRLHQEGRGADRDLVRAYMWYSLAATNGYYPAAGARDSLAPAMTAAQRAQAQQMAADWILMHGRAPTTTTTTTTQPTLPSGGYTTQSAYAEPYSVRAVQRVLNELGYPAGTADGVMGQKTRSAIRAFQIDAGLPVSGEPSRALYQELLAAREDQFPTPPVAQPLPQPQPLPTPTIPTTPTYDVQTIVDLQSELRRRGYEVPTVSGKLDAATSAAIREYQYDAGLAVDGRPSPMLLSHLRASSTGQTASTVYRDQVKTVQAMLNARGYDAGPPDGVMGPKTRIAIRTYQTDAGLPVTGDVSAVLLAELQDGQSLPPDDDFDDEFDDDFDDPYGDQYDDQYTDPYQPPQTMPQGEALVMAVEQELDRLGYPTQENDDGQFQKKSRDALRAFQKDAGFTVTTDLSAEVLSALRSGRGAPGSKLSQRYIAIEQALAVKGFSVGPVDGVIDQKARTAIREYEIAAGAPQTGYPTQALLNHLKSSTIRASGGSTTTTTTASTVFDIERELQRRLFSVGPIDGVVDSRTRIGIESYQRRAGLAVTGQPSVQLLAHMRAHPNLTAFSSSTSQGLAGDIIDLTP